MDITAIIASYKRPNFSFILDSLRSTDIKEIWIMNDDPDKVIDLGGRAYCENVHVFNNGKNLGAMARIALAVMAKTTHVLCHDDDLRIEGPKTIENLVYWQEMYPEAIVGYYGRQCKWDSDKPYTDGLYMAGGSYADVQPINIVFAKMMLAPVRKYARAWGLFSELKNYNMEDDVLMSLANLIEGHQNYLIPAKRDQGCVALSEYGQSLSERRGFWESRDAAVKCIVEERWGEARAALGAG